MLKAKRISSFFVMFLMGVALCVCAGCAPNNTTTSSTSEQTVVLNETVGLNGLSFDIDSTWKKSYSGDGLRIDPSSASVIAANTYLNGETKDIATYISKVGGVGNTTPQEYEVLREWDSEGVHYFLYNRDITGTTASDGKETRLLACNDKGIGFSIYFNRGEKSLSYPMNDDTVDRIIDTVKFEPSKVTGQNSLSSKSESSSSTNSGIIQVQPLRQSLNPML